MHFRADATPSAGDELQSEYLVARADAPDAVRAVGALAAALAPLVLVSEVRSVAADDLWISPAYGRSSVAIHFTWRARPAGSHGDAARRRSGAGAVRPAAALGEAGHDAPDRRLRPTRGLDRGAATESTPRERSATASSTRSAPEHPSVTVHAGGVSVGARRRVSVAVVRDCTLRPSTHRYGRLAARCAASAVASSASSPLSASPSPPRSRSSSASVGSSPVSCEPCPPRSLSSPASVGSSRVMSSSL